MAILICLLAGLGSACGDDEATNESTTLIPATTVAAPTAPATSAPTAESTVLITTASSVAPSATPTTSASRVIRIRPEGTSSPDGEVLYEAGVGSAPDQLGLQNCTECDRTRPLSPMMTSSGTLVIPDLQNRRWVVVDDGRASTVPLPAGLMAWDALLGPGDVVYVAAFTETLSGPADLEVVAFDAADLATVVARWRIRSRTFGDLVFDGEDVLVDLGPAEEAEHFALVHPAPDTMPTVEVGATLGLPSFAVTTPDGAATTWVLDERALPGEAVPLADGTVAVSGALVTEESFSFVVWRLRPDGTHTAQHVGATREHFNSMSVSERGIVFLELDGDTWQVVRFPLPT